jgi:aminopeptidase N
VSDPYFPDHGDPRFSVLHYDLELEVRIEGNRLDGRATLTAVARENLTEIELDLGAFSVTTVTVDGRKPARFRHVGGRLRISLANGVKADHELTVSVGYRGTPKAMPGVLGDAGWEELADGVIVAAQPYGAPSWFPCNDRPDDKATYQITVSAPTGYHVVANGTLIESRRRASAVTWVYEQPEPMAPYLATVNIGRYAVQNLDALVPMAVVVPGDLHLELPSSFSRQPEMLAAFVELFGPYPFASYTVVVTADDLEIPLESQGVSVFGLNYLRDDWDAERLVAHELAHQWFGNTVTASGWNDIWLHEGFACYSEWLWSEHSGRDSADEQAVRYWARLDGLPQDLLLGDPGASDMFDDRVYKRGALLLHAVRRTVGDDAFFTVLRTWTERHRDSSVRTEDFVRLAEELSGSDLGDLFNAWLYAEALPVLPAAR